MDGDFGHEQSDWDEELIDKLDFSDDDEEEDGSTTIKNAAQYLNWKPKPKSQNQMKQAYFKQIEKKAPNFEKAARLVRKKAELDTNFKKEYKDGNQNVFSADF